MACTIDYPLTCLFDLARHGTPEAELNAFAEAHGIDRRDVEAACTWARRPSD